MVYVIFRHIKNAALIPGIDSQQLEEGGRVSQISNKCSDRSMEVKLSALLGNYDLSQERPTDRRWHREVALPISSSHLENYD